MVIDSGGDGGDGSGAKKQRVDELDGRREAAGSDAILADRISSLPEELRLQFLKHLPLKDAIRTGALARGWRDLWKRRWAHRASREVHLCSREGTQRELDALAREPRPLRRLERFNLWVSTSYVKSSEFQRFLDYATECGVEDLHVVTRPRSKLKFHLPRSSPALARLSLRDITVSVFYKGVQRPFQALEVIRLVSVSFRPEAFTKMMAMCPSVLTLGLHSCRLNGWVLDADGLPPKLKSLAISHCDKIISPDFVRVPNLRSFRCSGHSSDLPLSIAHNAALSDLYINLRESWKEEWNLKKLRKSLPKDLSSLNVLTISSEALEVVSILAVDRASIQLSNFNFTNSLEELQLLMFKKEAAQLSNFNLNSLKELHLLIVKKEALHLNYLNNVYMFLKTFQCPNLERLFVELPAYAEGSIGQVWEEPPENGLDNLVMVRVMNFNWCPSEVQLVSFLLRKARSLQKLLILSRNVTPVDSLGAPEADLSLLKEALVNGTIIFNEFDYAATRPYHNDNIFCCNFS